MISITNVKRNVIFAAYLAIAALSGVLILGCYTVSPKVNEMLSLGEGDASGVPKLIEGLSDQDPAVRLAALESIVKLGPKAKETLPVLTKLLTASSSRDYRLPIEAVPGSELLGYQYNGPVIWATNNTVGHVEIQKYRSASDPGMKAFLEVARDPINYPVTAFVEITLGKVIDAIGAIGPQAESAVPSLTPFLHDTKSWFGKVIPGGKVVVDSYPLRVDAASALGNIGASAKHALSDLEWALQDEKKRLDLGQGSQGTIDTINEAISKIETG